MLLKLAQHLRDDGRPFLGEADLVHGVLGSSVVATSALVSVDQSLVGQRLSRLSTAALHTILVEVCLRGGGWCIRRGEGEGDVQPHTDDTFYMSFMPSHAGPQKKSLRRGPLGRRSLLCKTISKRPLWNGPSKDDFSNTDSSRDDETKRD